ncbi:exosortase C-terminal domain/associated protein EpsI [Megalodesulfovibrio paquesii]
MNNPMQPTAIPTPQACTGGSLAARIFGCALVCAMLIGTAVFLNTHRITPSPLPEPLAAFPNSIGPWRSTRDVAFTPSELQTLRPTDYLVRRYANDAGEIVELYIGYHDGGQDAGPLHSPRNCLPGGGWYREDSGFIQLKTPNGAASLAKAIFSQGAQRELFIYWFMASGEVYQDEYRFKIANVLNSILHSRQDSALVRVNVPLSGDSATAMATAVAFLELAFPDIQQALPARP